MDPDQKAAVISALSRIPNRFHTESRLQERVELVLTAAGVPFTREHRLDAKNRIDFLVDETLGIECKTCWNAADTDRQIYRYADLLPELVLVTSKPGNRQCVGTILNSRNEPVTVHLVETWKNPA